MWFFFVEDIISQILLDTEADGRRNVGIIFGTI